MKRLSKKQILKNAENNYLSYLKQYEMLKESHEKYRKNYGKTPDVESNFKKEIDFKWKKLQEFKRKYEVAKGNIE